MGDNMLKKEEIEPYWTEVANKHLKGKTVKRVRYLTEEEMEDMLWYCRPVVIIFEDGTAIYPSQDDEGNDAGSILGIEGKKNFILPVIR